jgi:hypothetical protein
MSEVQIDLTWLMVEEKLEKTPVSLPSNQQSQEDRDRGDL